MSNLTILYAEDDAQSRRSYTFVLEKYFSKVFTAENGQVALDIYHDKKPDMLLLDITMPFINGLELVKIVRKKNKEIPIIILTAHSEKEKLLDAIPLGLSHYLLKPIERKELKDVISRLIQEFQNSNICFLKENLSWSKTNSNLCYKEKLIKLTKKERKLMILLINVSGDYCPHDRLIIDIWDDEIPDASHDNKLRQLVHRLNKKINGVINTDVHLIENSYTLGYRINLSE